MCRPLAMQAEDPRPSAVESGEVSVLGVGTPRGVGGVYSAPANMFACVAVVGPAVSLH